MNTFLQKIFKIQFSRFLLVGCANTIFGSAIMFILYNCFGCSYWFSSASNYIIASILSFFLNKYFTFQRKGKTLLHFIKFAINIFVCYITAYWLAKEIIFALLQGSSNTLINNIAMSLGMILFIILNFLGQRYLVFTKREK